MKKILFVLALVLVIGVPNALAVSCKTTTGPNEEEQCFAQVQLQSSEYVLVSEGMLVVYDVWETSPLQGLKGRLSRASADNAIAVGFVQNRNSITAAGMGNSGYVTGDLVNVMVRGHGKVRTVGGVATGDKLVAAASGDVAQWWAGHNNVSSGDALAVAMETSSTNGTTARWAYIKVM